MKANITFLTMSMPDNLENKITIYSDDKASIHDVLYALGKVYVLSNVYIKDEEKKEN